MKDACRGCGLEQVRPFFDLGELPLAGGFLTEEQVPDEERYPLMVSVCDACGLVQIVHPVDPEILFQDYSFATGTVPGLVKHFDEYAGWIDRVLRSKSVIEFGCNDGTLIDALARRGVEALGIDLAANITKVASEQGRNVITGAFGMGAVPALLERTGRVDLITGSNVFAHNAEPGDILDAAGELLTDDGFLCLEVMYAGDLLEQLQWDTLYHEHLTFYSLGTLEKLLASHAFEAFRVERIPMHGGSLRLTAARKGAHSPDASVGELRAWEEARKLNDSSTWDGFADACRRRIDVFGDTMRDLSRVATIWGYGAAGKATMWVNACDMGYLGGMVDASPLRYGKLMPGTHTPIVSPDEFRLRQPDYVFVSAWNYLDAIRGNEPQYSGRWIVPLPEMRIH
jgi:novobiocin biosynthesis protein NovU/D-mycarose 3-C-methyltransferase